MPNSRVAVALRAFYDGSGKTSDPKCRFVTLAGYSATDSTWELFEAKWREALKELGIPYFHMIEALAGEGPFSREKGWNSDRALHSACKLICLLSHLPRNDLVGFICTIDTEGYKKASRLIEPKLRPLEAICVDWCFGGLFHRLVKDHDGKTLPVEAFFDKDEQFLHWADRVWRSKNAKKRFGWPALVATIAPVEMRQVMPIQAADIAAWGVRNMYENDSNLTAVGLSVILASNVQARFFGFDEIMQEFKDRKPWR
jgi:hypothetical protein